MSVNIDVLQEGMSLSVDNNTINYSDKASSQSITINTTGAWNAKSNEDWIHLSVSSGIGKATISISVDENISENTRTGKVLITAGDLDLTITIIQTGKFFTVDSGDKTFPSTGGTLQLSFSTNESWTAKLEEDVDWLTLSQTSGSGDAVINITAKNNASMKSRENAIIITPSNSQRIKIKIIQKGLYLQVDHSSLSFDKAGGSSETIKVSTNGEFGLTTSVEWLKAELNGQNSFVVSASENRGAVRSGEVIIMMKGLSNGESYYVYISVKQDGINTNGHACVDLGLPSGVLWATCNVGASKVTEAGDYYACGETITKQSFTSDTYKFYKGSMELTKYCTNSWSGKVDNKTQLDLTDDVARQTWGGSWRIPTEAEFDELCNYCKFQITTQSNISGVLVTGPNGKSIFFPVTGHYTEWGFSKGSGYYWTSTCSSSNNHYASYFIIQIAPGSSSFIQQQMRYYGSCIRAVCN